MATKTTKKTDTLTADEKAAMKEMVKERKAQAAKADGAKMVKDAIAKMEAGDKALAEKFARIVEAAAPSLAPKTFYGMPAWAGADGTVKVFFQDAGKFKARYSTFGFQDNTALDDGNLWATSFALTKIGEAEEKKIAALVKKAVG